MKNHNTTRAIQTSAASRMLAQVAKANSKHADDFVMLIATTLHFYADNIEDDGGERARFILGLLVPTKRKPAAKTKRKAAIGNRRELTGALA